MPILADFHVHSAFSGDSEAPMEEQVRAALRAGLRYLCFTEHLDPDFPYESSPDLVPGCFQIDDAAYRAELDRLRALYGSRIRLLCGVEIGLQPHLGGFLSDYMASHPYYDFAIGSGHVVYGEDPYYPAFYERHDPAQAYRDYFRELLEGIRAFHDFDTCGHLDYVMRYGPAGREGYSFGEYEDVIVPLLEALLDYDIALEINTSAMRPGTGCLHMNPLPEILQKYHSLGGRKITIGSDAHRPERVGFGFRDVCSLLRDLGFKEYAVYEGRKPRFLPL